MTAATCRRSFRARIFDQMRKADYVPHKLAQGLVRKKPRRIALFFFCKPAFFWNDMIRGIGIAAEKLEPFGYEVECHCRRRISTRKYLSMVKKVIERGVDGVAIVNEAFFDMPRIFRYLDSRDFATSRSISMRPTRTGGATWARPTGREGAWRESSSASSCRTSGSPG